MRACCADLIIYPQSISPFAAITLPMLGEALIFFSNSLRSIQRCLSKDPPGSGKEPHKAVMTTQGHREY